MGPAGSQGGPRRGHLPLYRWRSEVAQRSFAGSAYLRCDDRSARSQAAVRRRIRVFGLKFHRQRRNLAAHCRLRLQVGPPRDSRPKRREEDLRHHVRRQRLARPGGQSRPAWNAGLASPRERPPGCPVTPDITGRAAGVDVRRLTDRRAGGGRRRRWLPRAQPTRVRQGSRSRVVPPSGRACGCAAAINAAAAARTSAVRDWSAGDLQ
jgi:hypothetical protein